MRNIIPPPDNATTRSIGDTSRIDDAVAQIKSNLAQIDATADPTQKALLLSSIVNIAHSISGEPNNPQYIIAQPGIKKSMAKLQAKAEEVSKTQEVLSKELRALREEDAAHEVKMAKILKQMEGIDQKLRHFRAEERSLKDDFSWSFWTAPESSFDNPAKSCCKKQGVRGRVTVLLMIHNGSLEVGEADHRP